tara:strand:- start:562 stop:849 length:288 start_codon:yes stop_codon:yes gene_type:complete
MAKMYLKSNTKMTLVDGPFEKAEDNAERFAFNMLYSQALDESLRLIDIAQQEYDRAVEEDNEELMTLKKAELDYCLNCLRFSSIAAATDIDEPSP